jgi:hypothetical protein
MQNLKLLRRPQRFLFFALLVLGSAPICAQADFILHSWQNQHQSKGFSTLQLYAMFYTTSSNFDGTGNVTSPTGFKNYTRLQNDLLFSHGFSEKLTAFARASWAYINQNSEIRPGTSFGFADQTLGLNFRAIDSKSFSLDIQAQVDLPAYSNNTSEAKLTPYLGDGTIDSTAGGFIAIPLNHGKRDLFKLTGGAGYTYRTSNFSAAIPWSAYFEYEAGHDGMFALFGGYGTVSLRTDPNGLTSVPRSNVGSGGSYFIGGTNPSLAQIRGVLGYKLGTRTEFFLSVAQSVWGQASPNGINAALGFQTRFGADRKTHPLLQTPNDYGHSNSGFLNYSLESRILKSNDRLNLVKIDKGSQDGIEVGQVFDIFLVRKDGTTGDAIARARVSSVKLNESALEVTEYYKEVWIEEGFSAKRLIQ